jgi:hypothetical protein
MQKEINIIKVCIKFEIQLKYQVLLNYLNSIMLLLNSYIYSMFLLDFSMHI